MVRVRPSGIRCSPGHPFRRNRELLARRGDGIVETVARDSWNYRRGFGRCGTGDRTGITKKTSVPEGFRVVAIYFVVAEK
jgi:hypothetical protein